jgi:hypothetical protein
MVAGWAPGVRTIANSVLFHRMTGSGDSALETGAPTNWTVIAALESAHAVTNLSTFIVLL